MARQNKRPKPGPDDIAYVEAIIPNPGKTLLPLPQSKTLAIAVSTELRQLIAGGEFSIDHARTDAPEIQERIDRLASEYFQNRSAYNQKGLGDVRPAFEALLGNVERIEEALTIGYIRVAVGNEARSTLGQDQVGWLPEFSKNLTLLKRACQTAIELPPAKGSRPKSHIRRAVTGFAKLWGVLSGERYGKNVQLEDDTTGPLKSKASQFVSVLTTALDPNLTPSEIRSAMARIKVTHLEEAE